MTSPDRQHDRRLPWRAAASVWTLLALATACTPVAGASTTTRGGTAPVPVLPPVDAPANPPHAFLTRLELDVLAELNRARTDPAGYARHLEAMLGWFQGRNLRPPGSNVFIETREGPGAVREGIRALRSMRPVPAVTVSRGMSAGARDHARDQGRSGATGHAGSDGSRAAARVNRYGTWKLALSENIAYGPPTAREVVVGLIVDDGVPDRGHRTNMFDPMVRVVGVSCGRHPRYQVMCVIVHAHDYEEGRSEAP